MGKLQETIGMKLAKICYWKEIFQATLPTSCRPDHKTESMHLEVLEYMQWSVWLIVFWKRNLHGITRKPQGFTSNCTACNELHGNREILYSIAELFQRSGKMLLETMRVFWENDLRQLGGPRWENSEIWEMARGGVKIGAKSRKWNAYTTMTSSETRSLRAVS